MIISFVVAILWVLSLSASPAAQNNIVEAQRLRDQSNFSAAADLLRAELSQHPDNGDAARLLACAQCEPTAQELGSSTKQMLVQ